MRWRKGTTDHDGDGRMGGSRKEDDMTKAKSEARPDPQSGMDPTPAAEDRKAQTEAKFKEADKKGEPTQADIDEAMLGRQIRGY